MKKISNLITNLSVVLAITVSMFTLSSCEKVVGEGPLVTETRSVTDFKSVAVSISGKVNYKIDPVYKVEVQAQQNILDILETVKSGDELIIKFQNGRSVGSHEEITVTISAPYAEKVKMSGSALFNLQNTLTAPNLELTMSGSGMINIPGINLSDKLTATISGSGNISILNGTAKNENLSISGSGYINAESVLAEKVVGKVSGSGNMQINVSQSLDATISGSGSIMYHGNPPVITKSISGSGAVVPF